MTNEKIHFFQATNHYALIANEYGQHTLRRMIFFAEKMKKIEKKA